MVVVSGYTMGKAKSSFGDQRGKSISINIFYNIFIVFIYMYLYICIKLL